MIRLHPSDEKLHGIHSPFVFTRPGDVAFAARTTVAAMGAVLVAMWLHLDVPRWAIWTVLVVSPPVRGDAMRKTGSRIAGTLAGCVAGVALAALFPQNRLGYFTVFSVWLGSCAYWATLRRGYLSYAATLAAFTSAIVAADVSTLPEEVWRAAINRGSATMLGTILAFIASEAAARSDDVPGDLARRVSALAAEMLDWCARQLRPDAPAGQMDAPYTAQILGLEATIINATAERPALVRVRPWISGLPTALLSLQSAALRMRSRPREDDAASKSSDVAVLEGIADRLRVKDCPCLTMLQYESALLVGMSRGADGGNRAADVISPLRYLLGSLEAILCLRRPRVAVPRMYPPPTFVRRPVYALTNLARTVVGVLLAFAIWNYTAWANGDVFMINVVVALVLFVTMDDPVAGNWPNLFGTILGGLVGLAAKYLVLIHSDDPLWLIAVLSPLIFVGAWFETRPRLASHAAFYLNALLILIEPKNPQEYDFVQSMNVLIAIVLAYAFVPLVFIAVGGPRSGPGRVAQLLRHMRERRFEPCGSLPRRFAWQTQMYDQLARLQAATADARHRHTAVRFIVSQLNGGEA